MDVTKGGKIVRLLNDLDHQTGGAIDHLIISHPHSDHYDGGNRLAQEFEIKQATVAPFWNTYGSGAPGYQALIGRFYDDKTNVTFLSGYSRWYPEGAQIQPSGVGPQNAPSTPFLEMLGPTNGLMRVLEDAKILNTNHLSIIVSLCWGNFRMIIGADAQMENWAAFDHERMLEGGCNVLRAAHHGSANGTQWERLSRISPRIVVVSSDPGGRHRIPDLIGAAVFARYANSQKIPVVSTSDSGTLHLTVQAASKRSSLRCFGDTPNQNVDLTQGTSWPVQGRTTDWGNLINTRLATP